MIPYGRQHVDDDDIAAVVAVLKSDWLTQGPAVEAFESALTELTGATFAVAFSSATAGLHAACAVSGLGPGDLVVTSPLTFAASANCARFVGADVDLVDIDPTTLNLDLSLVPSHAEAVVAVHYAGLPVDLATLPHRPRVVIEDAAHAIGARTPDGPVGNCAHSDMTVFSFHPVKTVTTGEGGAVTTNQPRLADRLRRFRSHGTVPAPERGGWYYEIDEIGYNYRLTDIAAALGTSQLGKLDRFVERRNQIADRYADALASLPITLPPDTPTGWRHGRHLYPIRIADRDRVFRELRARGVGVQVHYVPVHRHPAYASPNLDPARFPVTERAYAELVSLPMFPTLTDDEFAHVIDTLREVI